MTRRKLPIGIQDFPTMRENDYYYVDKTALIRQLADKGRFYFLSRPRRFGKSLLLDTLGSLFEGNESLFRGLDIHRHWDWSTEHPVVRLSFDGKYNEPGDVERSVLNQLTIIERNAGLTSSPNPDTGPERFQDLLDRLHHKTGRQVVVLVDEYDKPILDVIENPDLAAANRDYLRGFYGIIKGSAKLVRFVFFTGVSMFSKVSLFSGLNNLKDISLDPRYATICGYTDEDIDQVFGPEFDDLDREQIRVWYNGYNWRGAESVYNPFDVLLLLDNREFSSWWFETGSPNFLFRMLKEKSVSPLDLQNRWVDKVLVSKFDVNDIAIEALLFQTGYLTIAEEKRQGFRTRYRLDYPNLEVRLSLNDQLLGYLGKTGADKEGEELCSLLETNEFAAFGERLRVFLAGIPYQWHASGDLARYEAWYASLLYMCLQATGVQLRVEDASSHGRADMVVLTGGQVFVLEFKMADGDIGTKAALDVAIAQMRERGYAEKYRGRGEPVHLVGVACGRVARNLLEVRAEPAWTG